MSRQASHRLFIMRHAKSDWNAGIDRDFDRPLSKRGIRDALKMADWMSEQNIRPDLLISSPSLRTRETAGIILSKSEMNPENVIWEQQLYEAGLNDLLGIVERYAGTADSILLIGHNPGVDSLLSLLAGEEPARTASGKLMTTAALAILDYGSSRITVKPGAGRLHRLIRPGDLS
ncbi:MAG: histidine phosphatase family protein [Gammaproteobacteria bacterium]